MLRIILYRSVSDFTVLFCYAQMPPVGLTMMISSSDEGVSEMVLNPPSESIISEI